MALPKKVRRVLVMSVAFIGGLWVCDRWMTSRSIADESTAATTSPTSRPATSRPTLSADVQAVVNRLTATYSMLPVRLEAEMTSDFDVAGQVEKKSYDITGVASGPDQYRHEAKGQLLVNSDGKALQLFDYTRNSFANAATDAKTDEAAGLRDQASDVLLQQDPALLIALGHEAVDAVSFEGHDVQLLKPETVDGKLFDRLESVSDGATRQVWIDHERGTIDHVAYDFSKTLQDHGAAEVKKATVDIRYSKTELAGTPLPAETFAFTPPADATPMASTKHGEMLAGGDASALEGKPAPDFELKDLDGKPTKLSDLKGHVIVLDFWATWCPPCRASLPHLAAAAAKYADQGVKVFAVNAGEDAATVKTYLTEQKLGLVALLDPDGVGNNKYGVSGIPQTVVIGADGIVRKVTVGFDPSDTSGLDAAIEAARK